MSEGPKARLQKTQVPATAQPPPGTTAPVKPSPAVGKNVEAVEEPYNPFKHRDVKQPTSTFGALAHLLKTSLGSGILAMPMAFKNAGLVLGVIGTVALGLICCHCVQMLIRSSQALCVRRRVPKLTYPETAEQAFLNGPNSAKRYAKAMGIMVTVQLLGSFTLGSTVYVVFIAESLCQICKHYWNIDISIRYFILMLWVPLILMCLLPNLKSLVPFSVVANILVLVSFSIVVYYLVRDIKHPDSVNLVSDIQRWPVFLCTIVFAIEGIGTVLSVEHEMEKPQYFIGGPCGILYIAMTIVIVVYTIVGALGYLQYGESTKGSITLNLPVNDQLGQAVKIMIALAIFFTYALQFYVPITILYDMVKDKIQPKHRLLIQFIIRSGLVTATIIMGLAIPNLEPVIGVVGAIAFSSLGLLIPALIDIMTRYPNMGLWKWRLIKNILISVLSIVTMISGFILSIFTAINEEKQKHDNAYLETQST